jgi:trans-aconitate 2-methyltransferase
MWDPGQYLKFSAERSRPFIDLVSRVPREEARFVADLGCGTGSLTQILVERWPGARIIGVDNSAEMLAKATPIPGRLEFVRADIADWSPPQPLEVIVSNAALHWIRDHASLLSRLVGMLAPGGTLAVQMPNRFDTASHFAVEDTLANPRWSARLEGVGLSRESVMPTLWYVRRLRELGLAVDAWETTYVHVMSGEAPVLEWLKGTALRPILDVLGPEQAGTFLQELGGRLRIAYPPEGNVTLFPMPRVFFVAQR